MLFTVTRLALGRSEMGYCVSKKMAFLGLGLLLIIHASPCSCSSRKPKGMVQKSPSALFTIPLKMNIFSAVQESTKKNYKIHFSKVWRDKWSAKHPRFNLHEVHTGPNPISNSFPWVKRKPVPQSP